MKQTGANPYLRTKVMTASNEELRLLLFDGALKFCRQGRIAFGKNDFENSYENITCAQNILLELSTSLNFNEDAELCDRLTALYTYMYRRLVDASMNQDTGPIDEVIQLLEYERDTWQMVLDRANQERAAATTTPGNSNAPAPAKTPRPQLGYGPSAGKPAVPGRLSQSA